MNDLKIVPSKEFENYFDIILKNEHWKTISRFIYQNVFIKMPQNVDVYGFKEIFNEKEKMYAKSCVLKLLSQKGYFSSEIRKKLIFKGFQQEAIDFAISEAQRLGAISDEQRLRYLAQKMLDRGSSVQLVKSSLKRLGAKEEDIKSCLDNASFDPQLQMYSLIRKKIKITNLKCRNTQKKIILMLQRRGFQLNEIFSLIEKMLKDDFA